MLNPTHLDNRARTRRRLFRRKQTDHELGYLLRLGPAPDRTLLHRHKCT